MAAPFVPVLHGATHDRPDEIDTIVTAEEIASVLARAGFRSEVVGLNGSMAALDRLALARPAAIYNLVESLEGSGRAALPVFARLDALGLAYTGTRGAAYARALSKLTTKAHLVENGLPTPRWWADGRAVPPDARVIVKSVDEHASLGMDQASVVAGHEAEAEIARREARFGGRFFAEAFLDGREFNVAVLERGGAPLVLPVQEIDFSASAEARLAIVDYDAKWAPHSAAYLGTPRRFGLEVREPALAGRLAVLARSAFAAFELAGYARVDIRLDGAGNPLILEVNANPCLAPDAGFAATAAEAAIAYQDLIVEILACALDAPVGAV